MESKLKLVEFCAGTGAFSLVFEKTNLVKTIFANDYEPNSEKIFNENFTIKLKCCDINTLDSKKDIPNHDILTAGFPCQPFSIAGNQEGFNDERSNVFWKLIDIIKNHKPRVVIFENVKRGLITTELNNALINFISFPNMSKESEIYKFLVNEVTKYMDSEELEYIDDIDIKITIIQTAELYEELYMKNGEFLLDNFKLQCSIRATPPYPPYTPL